jgi:exosortase
LGFCVLAIPTLVTLSQKAWSKEDEAHGPIVLATGGWLLWREIPGLQRNAVQGPDWLTFGIVLLALPVYVYGRAFDSVTLEAGAVYGVGLAIINLKFGIEGLKKIWFPLVYLGFAVPIPQILIDHLTAPLKHFVSFVATGVLAEVGLPVSRQGVTIMVAQYQLLVKDACSGMNSLIGLTAISLLYIYLMRRSSPIYALALICFVIPIAIAANIIRVIAIILITYFFGDEVGQSFIHMAAGLFLFSTALALIFGVDKALAATIAKARARQ